MSSARSTVYFNPRAPRGARPAGDDTGKVLTALFQSTRPARGATRKISCRSLRESLFQSTRPARGATLTLLANKNHRVISIHAPREGRDQIRVQRRYRHRISIHAPREGRDSVAMMEVVGVVYFNPRAPRGARPPRHRPPERPESISIHAPREGRDCCVRDRFQNIFISIHAPREGRDDFKREQHAPEFNISIHAPREGRDEENQCSTRLVSNFNPRAPRGARRSATGAPAGPFGFQSTRPARGATLLPVVRVRRV